jgi:3-hydroxyisobutyrate dehydrogenase-like beta-hydroxyacid dehydrogenase
MDDHRALPSENDVSTTTISAGGITNTRSIHSHATTVKMTESMLAAVTVERVMTASTIDQRCGLPTRELYPVLIG